MDLTGIYFIEELHHDESVEDDCVVLRWRGVQRGVAATVNVKDLFTCGRQTDTQHSYDMTGKAGIIALSH